MALGPDFLPLRPKPYQHRRVAWLAVERAYLKRQATRWLRPAAGQPRKDARRKVVRAGVMTKVDQFIAQGGSVCPFARGCTRHYVTVGRVPADKRKEIQATMRGFVGTAGKTPYHALLVVGPELPDFASMQTWAREVFLELMTCFGLIDGHPEKEVVRYVRNEIRPMLMDDANPRRPVLASANQPLFSICMSPLYPKTHPRYAPQSVVVVTWHEDVGAMHGTPAVARVRQVMRREHGSVYDADELTLPLPEGDDHGRAG
jgi:hypothetical protein